MFEAVPQELKESVEKALRKASRDAYELLGAAERLVDEVSEQLDAWADELASEPDTGGTDENPQSMYDYLLKNTNSTGEYASYAGAKLFLLSDWGLDTLRSLYESKKAEEWPSDDWWAGKTDKY